MQIGYHTITWGGVAGHVVGVKSVNDPDYRVNQHGLVWAGLAVRFGAECRVVGGGAQIRRAPKLTRNATASP